MIAILGPQIAIDRFLYCSPIFSGSTILLANRSNILNPFLYFIYLFGKWLACSSHIVPICLSLLTQVYDAWHAQLTSGLEHMVAIGITTGTEDGSPLPQSLGGRRCCWMVRVMLQHWIHVCRTQQTQFFHVSFSWDNLLSIQCRSDGQFASI